MPFFAQRPNAASLKNLLCLLLLLLNAAGLYCVADLSSYDEMTRYLKNGMEQFASPRRIVAVLFLNCVLNMLLVSAIVIRNFYSKHHPAL
jgi:hypothetical protein